jgi:hypothetical protein
MKRLICYLILTVGVLFTVRPAQAQPSVGFEVPKWEDLDFKPGFEQQRPATFKFLSVAPTARIAGMANTYTSIGDGMDAIFVNPSGIAQVKNLGFSFGYVDYWAGSKFYSGALAYNVGKNYVVGLSVISFTPPEMEETTNLAPTGTGKMLDTGDIALGLVVARQLTDKLSAGLQLRYIQSKLGPAELSTVSMDVGTLLNTGFRSLRLGMGLRNVSNEKVLLSEISEMPVEFNIGASMEAIGNLGDPLSLTTSFESAYFTDRGQRWHAGAELWAMNIAALRAGYKWNYDEESWSIGAGLRGGLGERDLRVDISYTDFGDLLGSPLRVSFSGSF